MANVKQTRVKMSPIVMAFWFVLLEFCATALFFVASVSADYGEIYKSFGFTSSLTFDVVEMIGVAGAEAIIIFWIFFFWLSSMYIFTRDRIIHSSGILFKRAMSIAMSDVRALVVRQSILGRLARYGTIEVQSFSEKNSTFLHFVPNPHHYVDVITRLKQNGNTVLLSQPKQNIRTLLATNEHEGLEFKTTFRWDMRESKVNKALERSVMKTVAAFLNSNGGTLVIGIDDARQPVGLLADYITLGRSDADGFENHFTNIFHAMIGREFRQYIQLTFQPVDGKECCVVQVSSSPRPVYMKTDEKTEEFFIRTGNTTSSLIFSEAATYIAAHFSEISNQS